MKIAVLSDIHDDKKTLSSVLDQIARQDIKMIFALGDYVSFTNFKRLAQTDLPIVAVFGNMDKSQEKIESWVREANKDITLRREMNRVKVDSRNIALTHFPEIAEKLLKSGMYDAVFFGHTHQAEQRFDEKTLVANPGAVKDRSYGVYDSETNEFKIVNV